MSELQLEGVKPTIKSEDQEGEHNDNKPKVDETDVNHNQPINIKPTEDDEDKRSSTGKKSSDSEVKGRDAGKGDSEVKVRVGKPG